MISAALARGADGLPFSLAEAAAGWLALLVAGGCCWPWCFACHPGTGAGSE